MRAERGFSLMELMIVVGITGVLAGIGLPMMSKTLGAYKVSGDVRSAANALQLTKLRAAADFTKTRLYVDESASSFHVEKWTAGSPGAWSTEGGLTYLADRTAESYSYGVVASPPANTQGTIGQAASCLTATGTAIGNTACIVFNSRGLPVTDKAAGTGDPTNADALYLTDGSAVFGVTVSATGVIQVWRTNPTATPNWTAQ
ncbi:MAG TPA: prepilin-type N-terminal cleavage/methylation domain-containing protein [Vicinamibacterales bacterium]|nr:prepilin-type N-terminal cleavage/methylation domain-containing protein [Vicinamibacterales bacterium]